MSDADAAAKRRQARREKILANSKIRLQRIANPGNYNKNVKHTVKIVYQPSSSALKRKLFKQI